MKIRSPTVNLLLTPACQSPSPEITREFSCVSFPRDSVHTAIEGCLCLHTQHVCV